MSEFDIKRARWRQEYADEWREMRRTRPHAEVMLRWKMCKSIRAALRSPVTAEQLLERIADDLEVRH